jgi:hypothetical protein
MPAGSSAMPTLAPRPDNRPPSPYNDQGQPKSKGEWFSSLMRHMTPSQPLIQTAPDGTQTVTDQRTGSSMAKMILASTLARIMSPTKYREGAYGPVVNSSGTAAAAFGAGADKGKEMSQSAQKQYDDMQSRKLNAVAANTAAMHQYAAMTQAQFAAEKEGAEAEAAQTKNWNDIVDQNKATIIASADDFDNNRSSSDAPKARLTSGMTTEELMASPFKDKMTSQLMFQDGIRSVFDPATGKTRPEPTWMVLNPDVDIKLNQAAVERAAKINPGFANLWQNTNGNVRLNLGRYAAITHQINSVDHAEDLLQSIADSKDTDLIKLGITGNVEGRLAAAARGNFSAMKSLLDFENATAHGGDTAAQLQRLLSSDGGDAIFKALGTDRDKVQGYVDTISNRKLKETTLAKEGADKAPAAPTRVAGFKAAVSKLPKEYQAPLFDDLGLDENGNPTRVPTNKDLDGFNNKIIDIQKTVDKENREAATPEAIADQVRLSIGAGDLSKARDLYSMKRETKSIYNTAFENKAIALGLNPNHFNIEAINQKSKTQEDYQPNGKIGQNLNSLRAFLQHGVDAKAANDTWQRSGSPDLDKSMAWWAKHATNDQNYQRFKASIIAPAQEYMTFLNNGHAESVGDRAKLDEILDPTATPQSIYTALQTFARTADDRAWGMGRGYVNAIGTTFPGLMDKPAIDGMKALGVDSRAKNVAGELPRAQSWVSTLQPQTIRVSDPQGKAIATQFLNAASGDKDLAKSMALEHGFIVTN